MVFVMSKFLTMEEFTNQIKKHRPEILDELGRTELEYQLIRQLIDARLEKNLTQKELAEMADIHQYQVSRIERGQLGNVDTLLKLLAAMNKMIVLVDSTDQEK